MRNIIERHQKTIEPLLPPNVDLPHPKERAFFPEQQPDQDRKAPQWVLDRTNNGENLVAVIAYGSAADGTKSSDSMEDYFVIIKDITQFNADNLKRDEQGGHRSDYGYPRRRHSAGFHTKLSRKHAPSFHYADYLSEDESLEKIPVKYAVLSLEDFEKGCHGSLGKDIEPKGDFGLYVAGRIQKAPLGKTFWPEEVSDQQRIETAINKARIDGIWLALGTVPHEFTTEDVINEYVSLSYRADTRIEDPMKVTKMIGSNKDNYIAMVSDLLDQFAESGIVTYDEATQHWTKMATPPDDALEKRFAELKKYNRKRIIKNTLDVGVFSGFAYELKKIKRVRQKKHANKQ